jgi:hypothetical protein
VKPLSAEAPVLELQAPQLEVLERSGEGEYEILRVRVTSPGRADLTLLGAKGLVSSETRRVTLSQDPVIDPESQESIAGVLDGMLEALPRRPEPRLLALKIVARPWQIEGEGWFGLAALPEEGVELELVRRRGQSIGLTLQDVHRGLPPEAAELVAARQAARAVPIQLGDQRWVSSTHVIK